MDTVPVQTFIDGFKEAESRFHAVMRNDDQQVAFKPLFEALTWAASLDDRCAYAWRKGKPTASPSEYWSDGFMYGDTVKGVVFARNRIHHAWADALVLSRSGGPRPDNDPDWFTWRRRQANELPGGKRRGKYPFESEFKDHVEAVQVVHTLTELDSCFADALPVLKP